MSSQRRSFLALVHSSSSARPLSPPAIGTMQAAHERGLVVPDDLSVIGFDGVERGELLSPQLTTVRQPLAEMGRTAVDLLLRLLERKRIEALRVELATRIIERQSTGPVRAA